MVARFLEKDKVNLKMQITQLEKEKMFQVLAIDGSPDNNM
jgi:hypothetical protein